MNAVRADAVPAQPASRMPLVGLLRVLLLLEALAGLVLAIFLSLYAESARDAIGGDAGRSAEVSLRFAAGGAFLFAIFAAIASRGARRRRSWGWTMAAVLQLALAIGTGIVVLAAEWHPIYLAGFGLATITMLVLSATSVRRALGQA